MVSAIQKERKIQGIGTDSTNGERRVSGASASFENRPRIASPEALAELEAIARAADRRRHLPTRVVDACSAQCATVSDVLLTALACVLNIVFLTPYRAWRAFGERGHMIDHTSFMMRKWEDLLWMLVLYSAVYIPLEMVFENEVQFVGYGVVDLLLVGFFGVDMLAKARSTYPDHGYTVADGRRVLVRYLRGWFVIDLVSTVPFDRLAEALDAPHLVIALARLLTMLRVTRVARNTSLLRGANALQVLQLMLWFVLIGHWMGLLWYVLAVVPLEEASAADPSFLGPLAPDGKPSVWVWINATDGNRNVGVRYTCSLYWALTVMTTLKSLEAHESRQCLASNPFVIDPVPERTYTILVFIVGAIAYSTIYGNIHQFVQDLYGSSLRYRRRIDEMTEFARFHGLPPALRQQIRSYVDFAFAVTKGINVDAISQQLPANLQLEIHLHLNKKMVEQVRIFTGCPHDFYLSLVTRLQPTICVMGDYVFYAGDTGTKMYFVKRGTAVVLDPGGATIHTFKEGDYFGEMALLTDKPRTADIKATSDCMLLSLGKADLEAVLNIYPAARLRIEHAMRERERDMLAKQTMSSGAPTAGVDAPRDRQGSVVRQLSQKILERASERLHSTTDRSSTNEPAGAATANLRRVSSRSRVHPEPMVNAETNGHTVNDRIVPRGGAAPGTAPVPGSGPRRDSVSCRMRKCSVSISSRAEQLRSRCTSDDDRPEAKGARRMSLDQVEAHYKRAAMPRTAALGSPSSPEPPPLEEQQQIPPDPPELYSAPHGTNTGGLATCESAHRDRYSDESLEDSEGGDSPPPSVPMVVGLDALRGFESPDLTTLQTSSLPTLTETDENSGNGGSFRGLGAPASGYPDVDAPPAPQVSIFGKRHSSVGRAGRLSRASHESGSGSSGRDDEEEMNTYAEAEGARRNSVTYAEAEGARRNSVISVADSCCSMSSTCQRSSATRKGLGGVGRVRTLSALLKSGARKPNPSATSSGGSSGNVMGSEERLEAMITSANEMLIAQLEKHIERSRNELLGAVSSMRTEMKHEIGKVHLQLDQVKSSLTDRWVH